MTRPKSSEISTPANELKRDLGLYAAISIVIGTVIGSGIFRVPQTMTQSAGSVGMVFAVWIVGGILTLAGALTYAELASMLPGAGGEYVYLTEAYGPMWGFLYGWTQMWVAKSGSIATLATAFFEYSGNFWPALEHVFFRIPLPLGEHGAPLAVSYGQILAIAMILFLAIVNYFGVKAGGNLQVAITALKVGLIVFIILAGLWHGNSAESHAPVTGPSVGGFFAALVAALWAYDGWNNVGMVASEVKDPKRNLPRALIGGSIAVMAIYIVINYAYFLVLSPATIASHKLVAAEMMRRIEGQTGANWVSLAAMISIFAALNGSILTGARVPYAMARDGSFFKSIAFVHPRFRTPGMSILALSAWSAVLVLSGRYDQLYTYVIFASWILYAMAAASVIVLRSKRPDLPRPYRTLGYPVVPILFVATAALLEVFTLKQSPRESIAGIMLILLGLPFYFYWKRRSAVPPR
jgi:APA family basic amino acid/polyamine antiporter